MKCIQVKKKLELFLDSEMSFSERESIDSHLKNCESCIAEVEGMKAIGQTMKQNLRLVTPASVDNEVFRAFENRHTEKHPVETEKEQEKVGWLGIPKFAFAAGLLMLAIFSGIAFQVGKMSAVSIPTSLQISETKPEKDNFAKKESAQINDTERKVETRIIEVPVVKEKIVKVPVIREKVVTRLVYVAKNKTREIPGFSENENVTVNNSVKDGEVLTQTNLKGFQPVAEVKLKISKKEK